MKSVNNKQRLFELMAKLDSSFKPKLMITDSNLINESYIYEADNDDIEGDENAYGQSREDTGIPEPESTDANKDVEIPVINKPVNSTNFNVTIQIFNEKYADREIQKIYKMASKYGLPQPIVTKG